MPLSVCFRWLLDRSLHSNWLRLFRLDPWLRFLPNRCGCNDLLISLNLWDRLLVIRRRHWLWLLMRSDHNNLSGFENRLLWISLHLVVMDLFFYLKSLLVNLGRLSFNILECLFDLGPIKRLFLSIIVLRNLLVALDMVLGPINVEF